MRRNFVILVVLVVAAASCGWARPRFDVANSGGNPFETSISVANVNTLTKQYTATPPIVGLPQTAVSNGFLYADQYAFDAAGLQKWSLHTKGVIEAQPLVDGDGTIYFGTKKGLVYAVNPNGTVLWTSIAGSPISQSGVLTSNGTFYVGTDEGFVFAFPRSN